jgi:hypothetical protein
MAPAARLVMGGKRRVERELKVRVLYRDRGASPSGVSRVLIQWGDGTKTRVRATSSRAKHVYRAPGRYRLKLLVADRAGNRTVLVRYVRIRARSPRRRPSGRKTPSHP